TASEELTFITVVETPSIVTVLIARRLAFAGSQDKKAMAPISSVMGIAVRRINLCWNMVSPCFATQYGRRACPLRLRATRSLMPQSLLPARAGSRISEREGRASERNTATSRPDAVIPPLGTAPVA